MHQLFRSFFTKTQAMSEPGYEFGRKGKKREMQKKKIESFATPNRKNGKKENDERGSRKERCRK